MKIAKYILCLTILFFFAGNSWARHIYGGDFSMSALGNSRYLLTLNLYFDETQVMVDAYDMNIPAKIYRKSDNSYVATFNLPRTSVTSIIYDNLACAELRQLKTSEVRYSNVVILASTIYRDPDGYYVVWERCCRNAAVTNINNPGNVGMAFLLEFPPVVVNNVAFRNSAPDFSLPNGDYICINKPFQFNMSARDADGDELRYSLIDPVAGFTSSGQATIAANIGRFPYPPARWINGFNANAAIKGPKPLSINPKTGIMSVTANETGLYAFAVLIEEYRRGVKIGAVRREFQLPVVDCSKTTPPVQTIFKDENLTLPLKTVEICDGNYADLFVKSSTDWAYQWQKNGENIPDATSNVYRANQSGDYQVVVSFTRTCANDTVSQITKVTKGKTPNAKLVPTDTLKVCEGDSATLIATTSTAFKYEWNFNETPINHTVNILKVKLTGNYEVVVRQGGINCPARDTIYFATVPLPKAILTASKNMFCPEDSLKLKTVLKSDEKAEWRKNNVVFDYTDSVYFAKESGTYRVRIYNGKCSALSDSIKIQTFSVPKINLDTLSEVCYDVNLVVPLVVSPTGGTFSGKGLTANNTLSVKALGVGTNKIQYKLPTKDGCNVIATQKVVVKPSPVVKLPTQIAVPRGESVEIKPKSDSTTYTFSWEPPLYLSDANVQNPSATVPITTDYVLTTTGQNGCVTKTKTRIYVHDGLFFPDVFTPNGDGRNDVWEIKNIEKYPQTEVYIYNRWGELLFYQKGYKQPFDGNYQGKPLAEGIYVFLIDTHIGGESSIIRGQLMIIR